MAVEVGSLVARSVVEHVVCRNKVAEPSPKVIEPSVGRDGDVDIFGPEVTPPACEFYAALAGKAQRCTRKVLWIADTGSGNHLSSPSQLESSTMSAMKACSDDIRLATANGQVSPEGELDVHLPELGLDARLLVLKSCPRVLSVGRLVEDHGLEFHWATGRQAERFSRAQGGSLSSAR